MVTSLPRGKSGMYFDNLSAVLIRPSSWSLRMAAAVNCFEIEPILNLVSGVTLIFFSILAYPNPFWKIISPFWETNTEAPGMVSICSLLNMFEIQLSNPGFLLVSRACRLKLTVKLREMIMNETKPIIFFIITFLWVVV